jgi:SAM-dependent methyltransferase
MNIIRRLLTPYIYLRDKYVDWRIKGLSEKDRFRLIYKAGYWRSGTNGSLSGTGSDEGSTVNIHKSLVNFLKDNHIKTILDLPCGDWNWMSHVDLGNVNYIGADIVDAVINSNQKRFGSLNRNFKVLDILNDDLPKVDLIFVRDCFVHLEDEQIIKAIKNIAKSNSIFLATTTYPQCNLNQTPVKIDRWRQLNLEIKPFFLPEALSLLDDRCYSDPLDVEKYMGIWKISDLRKL